MADQVDIKQVAGQVAQVDEAVMRFFPFISTMIGFGAPEAAPFLPLIEGILKAIDNAAKDIQSGNTEAIVEDILKEIRNHNIPGFPNSSILSSPRPKIVANDPSMDETEATSG